MTSLAEKLESQQPMTADDAKEAVKDKSQEVRTQASDRLRQEVESRSSRAAEQMQSFAQTMRRTASELRAQGQQGQGSLFDQAAMRAEQLAGYLTTPMPTSCCPRRAARGACPPIRATAVASRRGRRRRAEGSREPVGRCRRRDHSRAGGTPANAGTLRKPARRATSARAADEEGVARARSLGGRRRHAKHEQARPDRRASGAGSRRRREVATGRRQVEQVLEAVRYPAGKAKLLSEAERQGVGHQLRRTLERLPQRTFRRPSEVRKAIDTLD
jgi:hypothetical protein